MDENDSRLPRSLIIDGVQYTILKLGSPVVTKNPNKTSLAAISFCVEDLTLVGLPLENAVDGQDQFSFHWIVYCYGAATQKILAPDLLKDILEFTKAANVLPIAPPNNRQLISLPDGGSTLVPVLPELPAPGDKKRRAPANKTAVKTQAKKAKGPKMSGPIVKALESFATGTIIVEEAILKAFSAGMTLTDDICSSFPSSMNASAFDIVPVKPKPVAPVEEEEDEAEEEDEEVSETAEPPKKKRGKGFIPTSPQFDGGQTSGGRANILLADVIASLPEGTVSWEKVQSWARIVLG